MCSSGHQEGEVRAKPCAPVSLAPEPPPQTHSRLLEHSRSAHAVHTPPHRVPLQSADEDGSGELDVDEFCVKLGPLLGTNMTHAQVGGFRCEVVCAGCCAQGAWAAPRSSLAEGRDAARPRPGDAAAPGSVARG